MPRGDRPDPRVLELWEVLLVAERRLVERLDAEMRAAHDLPLEWYDVLHQLQRAGGTLTMGALADALVIGASRCSRRVDRLVDEGLVERRRDTADGRVVHADLTDRGRARHRRAAVTHLAGIQRHLGRVLDPELAARLTPMLSAAIESARG